MKQFNIIPIVFITDRNFSIPTAVAISSLIANKKKETFYKINIISADLNKDIEDKLYSFSENENININIVRVNENKYRMFHRKGYHVSSTALYKFEIPNLLPEYNKILYLDGDILVKDDLRELYNSELDNYYVGAVRDMTAEVSHKMHKKIPVDKYLNSGVMLLNLKNIREDNLTYRAIETLYERGHDYVCIDQDVFNFIFKENILWLNPEYNAMISNLILEKYTIEEINQFYATNYTSIEHLIKNASILHLTNDKKPWHNKFTFMNKEWFEYFRKSPFKELTELDNFETETWEAEIQCQRRNKELVEKERLLHSIYVSRSWRITAPLRGLSTAIRRLNDPAKPCSFLLYKFLGIILRFFRLFFRNLLMLSGAIFRGIKGFGKKQLRAITHWLGKHFFLRRVAALFLKPFPRVKKYLQKTLWNFTVDFNASHVCRRDSTQKFFLPDDYYGEKLSVDEILSRIRTELNNLACKKQ